MQSFLRVSSLLKIFKTGSDLHKMAVWCYKCQEEWHCEFYNVWTRCIECDKGLGCKAKYNRHWNRKHKLEWTETFPLKHLEKFEEASVNRKHNGNITLCKKL